MSYDSTWTMDNYYKNCSDYLSSIKMGYFKEGFLYSKCYFVEGFLRQCSSEALYYSWNKHHRLVPDNYNFLRL